jgi:putative Mg2+ transporter-C (MgtC) family protein
VGVGLFAAAILLTALSVVLMMWGPKLEGRLPSRRAMGVTLKFTPGLEPDENNLKATIVQWGYIVAEGSLNIKATPCRSLGNS